MKTIPFSSCRRMAVEPVIASRGPVPGWARDMEVRNPFFTFWGIERGSLALAWGDRRRLLRAGACVLIPCGLQRRHVFSLDARIVSLNFWAGWDDGRPLVLAPDPIIARGALAADLTRRAGAAAARVADFPRRLSEAELPPAAWMAFSGALGLAVSAILEWAARSGGEWVDPSVLDSRLERVLEDLRERPVAGPLPFKRWRNETGLGRVQLDRLAVRHIGQTLRARRDEILLERIRKALLREPDSLKELGARFGFHDAPHFTRWVAARAGRTPKSLRDDPA